MLFKNNALAEKIEAVAGALVQKLDTAAQNPEPLAQLKSLVEVRDEASERLGYLRDRAMDRQGGGTAGAVLSFIVGFIALLYGGVAVPVVAGVLMIAGITVGLAYGPAQEKARQAAKDITQEAETRSEAIIEANPTIKEQEPQLVRALRDPFTVAAEKKRRDNLEQVRASSAYAAAQKAAAPRQSQ